MIVLVIVLVVVFVLIVVVLVDITIVTIFVVVRGNVFVNFKLRLYRWNCLTVSGSCTVFFFSERRRVELTISDITVRSRLVGPQPTDQPPRTFFLENVPDLSSPTWGVQ